MASLHQFQMIKLSRSWKMLQRQTRLKRNKENIYCHTNLIENSKKDAYTKETKILQRSQPQSTDSFYFVLFFLHGKEDRHRIVLSLGANGYMHHWPYSNTSRSCPLQPFLDPLHMLLPLT